MLAAAQRTAKELGLTGIEQKVGPLEDGAPASAPYDIILIEGAVRWSRSRSSISLSMEGG